MINGKKIIAVIPARKGSKRLPNKNILTLARKPLVSWTIESALKSKYIDKIILSTDSDQISKLAIEMGIDVPFIRPKELATDTATSFDVVKHALNCCGDGFDIVLLLQPTSPLRTNEDIDGALDLLANKKAHAVVSVCDTEHSPLFCNTLDDSLSMKGFLNDKLKNKRTQDLPKYYRINGAVYAIYINELLKENTFFVSDKIYAYIMPQKRSVDIDTKLDFKLAETILNDK